MSNPRTELESALYRVKRRWRGAELLRVFAAAAAALATVMLVASGVSVLLRPRGVALDAGTRRPQLLATLPLQGPERERQDLWNTGWAFGAVVLLLGVEWTLRRRWGMR